MHGRPRNRTRLTDILALRSDIAAARLILQGRVVHRLMLKAGYNPAQPRLPRGVPEGGQWTGGGGALDAPFRKPPIGSRVRVAQSGRGGRFLRSSVQTSRGPMEANPRQAVEAAIATMWADRAVGIVRRVDSRWSPTPSLHTTIEAEIAYQRGIPREAARYLDSIRRPIGAPAPLASPRRGIGDNGGPPLDPLAGPRQAPSPYTILVPDGRIIGYRAGGAGYNIRTLEPETFDAALLRLTEGLVGREPNNTYGSLYYYYDLPDRCVIGFRMSARNGLTFDIIESSEKVLLPKRTKFHRGR